MGYSFESYIARRYLKGAQGTSEGRQFLKLITYISVGGVALGVATLILVLSIVRGFSQEIQSKVIGFGAHVQIESIRDAPLERGAILRSIAEEIDGVTLVSPVIQEFILLRRSSREIEGVSIWGTEQLPGYIAETLTDGRGDLSVSASGRPGIVIGAKLSRSLGAEVGSLVTAFSVNTAALSSGKAAPLLKQFEVRGIYETSLANFDELYVFTDLQEAATLLEYVPGQVSRLDVRVEEGMDFTEAADLIDAELEFPAIARPITDVYRSLFAWVKLQESIIPLVISIIIFVAAINIIGTLLMIILEKSAEMGVMASFGTSARTRKRIFLLLGLYIGVAGIVIGETFALLFSFAQLKYEIIPLPAEAYYMSTAPIALSVMDFVVVAVLTLILCGLSSYIPARHAARVSPLRAISSR